MPPQPLTGCLPALVAIAPLSAVTYGLFDLLKQTHFQRLRKQQADDGLDDTQPLALPPMYRLQYGALSAAAGELIVYPLEVVRRRMQLQSMAAAGAARAAAKVGGGGVVAAAAARTGPAEAAAAVSAAGAALTHTASAAKSGGSFAQAWAVGKAIFRAEGFRGFYAGMGPNLLQVLPGAAITFYTYDTLKALLDVE